MLSIASYRMMQKKPEQKLSIHNQGALKSVGMRKGEQDWQTDAALFGCKEFEHLASSYIDRDISADNAEKCRTHLKQCSECFKLYNDIKAILEEAKSLKDRPIPADVSSRLHHAIKTSAKFSDSVSDSIVSPDGPVSRLNRIK